MAECKRVVLLAIDPSKQAREAVDYYVRHLHKPENDIVLLHIVDLPDMAHARQAYLSPAALAEVWKEEGEKAKNLELSYKEQLEDQGVDQIRIRTEGGLKPGQVVCQVAAEENATMVIMGTRGMGKIRRTLLGSVSDYVVHHANCPVVVCRKAAPYLGRAESEASLSEASNAS